MPDPVSSLSLTVLVRRPYEDQRRKENLIVGEYIYDVEQFNSEWWRGTTADGKRGVFPAGHVVESVVPNEAEVPPLQLSVRPAPKNRTLTMLVLRPYEAQEDDEINLIEGGYIYDVEQLIRRWTVERHHGGWEKGIVPCQLCQGKYSS